MSKVCNKRNEKKLFHSSLAFLITFLATKFTVKLLFEVKSYLQQMIHSSHITKIKLFVQKTVWFCFIAFTEGFDCKIIGNFLSSSHGFLPPVTLSQSSTFSGQSQTFSFGLKTKFTGHGI